jgi:hypothetical protein
MARLCLGLWAVNARFVALDEVLVLVECHFFCHRVSSVGQMAKNVSFLGFFFLLFWIAIAIDISAHCGFV